MKINYNSMMIYVKDNYDEMSKKAARMIGAQVTLKGNSVVGLATGSTPEGMYQELVKMHQNEEVDFSEITTFNLDEYYQLPTDNNQSYAYYMNENFFKHVNVPVESVHIPNGISEDVDRVCEDYDQAIRDAGNMDIQILGIGNNGHIGFNEPDVKFEAGTHLVDLDMDTIEANARFFDSIDDVPRQAISMGIRNIMHSKKIVLVANGEKKAKILKEMLFGPVTPNVPASVLQLHNDVTIILDQLAAADILDELKERNII